MLDETESKTDACTKLKRVIDIELKEDNLSQRNGQNQLSHQGLSHTEQEC